MHNNVQLGIAFRFYQLGLLTINGTDIEENSSIRHEGWKFVACMLVLAFFEVQIIK